MRFKDLGFRTAEMLQKKINIYIFSFNSAELSFQYSLFRSTSRQQDNRHAYAEGISSVCVSAVFDGTLLRGGKCGTPATIAWRDQQRIRSSYQVCRHFIAVTQTLLEDFLSSSSVKCTSLSFPSVAFGL